MTHIGRIRAAEGVGAGESQDPTSRRSRRDQDARWDLLHAAVFRRGVKRHWLRRWARPSLEIELRIDVVWTGLVLLAWHLW